MGKLLWRIPIQLQDLHKNQCNRCPPPLLLLERFGGSRESDGAAEEKTGRGEKQEIRCRRVEERGKPSIK